MIRKKILVVIPKTNKDYISATYDFIRFIVSYRFLSSTLDKLNNSFIEIKYKSLTFFEEEFPDNEIILNTITELEFLTSNDNYENESIENLVENFPDKLEK